MFQIALASDARAIDNSMHSVIRCGGAEWGQSGEILARGTFQIIHCKPTRESATSRNGRETCACDKERKSHKLATWVTPLWSVAMESSPQSCPGCFSNSGEDFLKAPYWRSREISL
ncbi:hypothetical protein TMatcc_007670 [Talaromyces marneffei ATCC 18224]